jgi:hypothetical protein
VLRASLVGLAALGLGRRRLDEPAAGKPSCVVREAGGVNAVVVPSTVGIADGTWHKVSCQRTSTALQILVDSVVRGSKPLASTYSVNPSGQQVAAGAKSAGKNNDQFHGRLDDVYFNID